MAIQKKSLIGKRQSVKKALVAKSVSADAPKAEQVKSPNLVAGHNKFTFAAGHNRSTFVAGRNRSTYVAAHNRSTYKSL